VCRSVRAGLVFAWGDGDDATGDRPARKTAIGYRVAASSGPPSPRKQSLLDICHLSKAKEAPFLGSQSTSRTSFPRLSLPEPRVCPCTARVTLLPSVNRHGESRFSDTYLYFRKGPLKSLP